MVEMEMEKEHDKLVAKILKMLEKNDLYVKPEKCKWKVKEVDSLEIVLGLEGIKIEEAKVKVVLDWPVSKLVKNIQKFLQLVNYYRRFIEKFAKIARPLDELMRKKQKWEQELKQKKSFETLKKQFIIESILVIPDLDNKMRMEVNASDFITEGVLYIEYNDGKQRPVAYLQKLLNKTEINYEIHNKEMLAVIRRVENWRHLLKNTRFKFKIWTNYKNLEYFIKAQKLNKGQVR